MVNELPEWVITWKDGLAYPDKYTIVSAKDAREALDKFLAQQKGQILRIAVDRPRGVLA